MGVTVDDDLNISVAEYDNGGENTISPSIDSKTHRQLFSTLVKLSYPIILCELFQSLMPVGKGTYDEEILNLYVAISTYCANFIHFIIVFSS
jgi:hypothetical protein